MYVLQIRSIFLFLKVIYAIYTSQSGVYSHCENAVLQSVALVDYEFLFKALYADMCGIELMFCMCARAYVPVYMQTYF